MKKFQRKIEDFTCMNCHQQVQGNGYTNHCPNCLWSRHVDINPGDRASTCRGLMRPIGIEIKNSTVSVFQKCEQCGFIHKNRISEQDNQEAIIKLSTMPHRAA